MQYWKVSPFRGTAILYGAGGQMKVTLFCFNVSTPELVRLVLCLGAADEIMINSLKYFKHLP